MEGNRVFIMARFGDWCQDVVIKRINEEVNYHVFRKPSPD
jgi:hypothetical protein